MRYDTGRNVWTGQLSTGAMVVVRGGVFARALKRCIGSGSAVGAKMLFEPDFWLLLNPSGIWCEQPGVPITPARWWQFWKRR